MLRSPLQEQPALSAGVRLGGQKGTRATAPPGGSSSPHLSEAPPSTPGTKKRTRGTERTEGWGSMNDTKWVKRSRRRWIWPDEAPASLLPPRRELPAPITARQLRAAFCSCTYSWCSSCTSPSLTLSSPFYVVLKRSHWRSHCAEEPDALKQSVTCRNPEVVSCENAAV